MLYRMKKGVVEKISPTEAKQKIMRVNNWTEEQYNKERYKLKNKIRAYETFKEAHGIKITKPISPVELLYKQAGSKEKYGKDYEKSAQLKRIEQFASYGNVKTAKKKFQSEKVNKKYSDIFNQSTLNSFEGLIKKDKYAKMIYENVKDVVQLEEALKKYAEARKKKIKEDGKVEEQEAIPIGTEVSGSGPEMKDFDINDYLE